MSKIYSKRGNCLSLSSYDIDHIFYGLKNGYSLDRILSTFLFELSLDNGLKGFSDDELTSLHIFIPFHKKYERFNNQFESFIDLFNYMKANRKDGLIIPFYGDDI